MPLVHGKASSVLLDGTDLSTYLNLAGVDVAVDPAETTTFQAGWKTYIAGEIGAKADFTGLYDPAQLAIRNHLRVSSPRS